MNILEVGSPERNELDAIREKIASKGNRITEIKKLPITEEELRARLKGEIDRMLERGNTASQVSMHGRAGVQTNNLWANFDPCLLILLLGGADKVTEQLIEIARQDWWDESIAISDADRAKQIAKLQAERHRLEVKEEKETLRLEDDGYDIFRRADLNPEVVFEVWNRMDAA